ncbi:MAG: PAS domain S-box protein [Myxococcales bacterium]
MHGKDAERLWLERELSELRARETKYRTRLSDQEAEATRLREYAHSLHRLLQRRPPLREELSHTLRAVASLSARALGVSRANVWFIDQERHELRCAVQLVADTELPVDSMVLPLAKCPNYLHALADESALAVTDVYEDPRTQELASYFRQHNIGALLDIPIVIPGQLLGVVCHEHVGGPRRWLSGEIELASNVGHLVALTLETERRLTAEFSARDSEARYRYLVESLPVTVYSFDGKTGKLQYVSPQAVTLGGESAQQWLKQGAGPWLHRIHPDDRANVRLRFERGLAGGFPEEVVYRVNFEDGSTRFVRDTCRVVRDSWGEAIAIQGVLSDVTENVETQRARDEIERRYKAILENVDVIAVALDLQGRVTFANDAFLRVSGRSRQELMGLDWFEASLAPEQRDPVRKRFLTDMARDTVAPRFELPITTTSGQTRQLLATNTLLRSADGKTQGTLSLALDVTDRRNLEQQLMHQTKLESLGRLAAGVAHDFNNLLTVMLGQLDMLETRFAATMDPTTQTMFEALGSAIDQAADLTRSLLLYGRQQTSHAEVFVLDDLVRDSLPLLEACAAGGADLSLSLNAPDAALSSDRGRMRQVLLNLVGNAVDATRDFGSSIRISTHVDLIDDAVARGHGAPRGGECVVLSVSDDGRGMDAITRARVFDPFFTTKLDGRGTGLGLAITQTIVSQMNGFVDVMSEPDKGTTFRVHLPLRKQNGHATASTPSLALEPSGRILVVQDSALLRNHIETTLRQAGYDVFAVTDIRGATEALSSAKFDLLITDSQLTDGSGAALARSARRLEDLKVVLISDSQASEEFADETLISPFDPATLLSLVSRAIDSNRGV